MMDLFSIFRPLDERVLTLVNKTLTHPALDSFFSYITEFHHTSFFKFVFVPVFLILILRKGGINGIYWAVGFIISVGLTDFLGGQVIKPFFARPRPSVAGLDVILRAPHFGGYSFVSNHALNVFCAAMFLTNLFPRFSKALFVYATLVAYSRVYCGVHYPSDVVVGALLGVLIGTLTGKLTKYLVARRALKMKEGTANE